MIDVLHFVPPLVTTYQFWTGALGGGLVTLAGNMIKDRLSDRRKFKNENKMQDRKEDRDDDVQTRKEDREDKLREEQSLMAAAEEFTQTCTEILVAAIDVKGAFNTIRDFVNNLTGKDDPAAEAKLDHAQKVVDAQNRIAVPLNRLKLTATEHVCDAATKATTAIMTVVQLTTEPFAVRAAHNAASDELNNFINVVRKEIGKGEYTSERAKEQVFSFLGTLQRQTDDFVESAREEMRAAGFQTTPWDSYVRKTPTVPTV
ncbi:hypothetical protein MSIMFB_01074 [Mycobacterium simulans]|uniref:Uncharacterized protein n=1 Tax=Mycobacterium simulans TaxID=627089 RepID=A0A7Z7IJM1_9MYCO|nr:hypothetical protein [Mycobacterium simulans]SOJ53573.1 hypothetical protein MSIMFB_01074 [Mycobacterium simulans]